MFGLGFWEIVIVAIVALLVLGPERLPEAARTLGRAMGALRKTADQMRAEIGFSHFDSTFDNLEAFDTWDAKSEKNELSLRQESPPDKDV